MSEIATTHRHLLYLADPMCSWCYGFAPGIEGLVDHFGDRLPIGIVMGGLRTGAISAMTGSDKAALSAQWQKVIEATGQPFNFALFHRRGWIYDTEPACRALVTMRLLNPPLVLAYLARVQTAFHADNRDTTRNDVLADIAAEAGVDREMFFAELVSPEARLATTQDFEIAKQTGIRGFPTLLAGDGNGHYLVVTNGYRPLDGLPDALDSWLESTN